ncbi:MAG: aminodeoxychorismate synthase component I [Flavobacteriia bacterium]|nr:MAG: aminodeoxychorismate synthase component I [Flavobacteriia bacterium]
MRVNKSISLKNEPDFKKNLLAWAQQHKVVFWLDSNAAAENFNVKYSSFKAVLALDVHRELKCDYKGAFNRLKTFRKECNDYIFGYFSYDLKNDIEQLTSDNFYGLQFPDLYFFQPKKLFFFKDDHLNLSYLEDYQSEMEQDLSEIKGFKAEHQKNTQPEKIRIKERISKQSYFKKIHAVLDHIHRGDIYEVNFCQEFYTENASIEPLTVYRKLNKISGPPFANFVKLNDQYLLSASPERFVKKIGSKIISQPIKGTARRSEDPDEDMKLAKELSMDLKERTENIMIVDLVRNDLSKTSVKGSVKVEELCGVYSFKQVHQLISTVTSLISQETDAVEVIKSLFPMGSMTGAPKISAMEIIEELEESKRGLYSGAVGYFTPEGDFDFNVVIRSILYNKQQQYISFTVGGAITSRSIIEKEYEECLVKAEAMKKALNT